MYQIQKVRYSHDAMIDLIIGDPAITQGQLAAHFGYTQGWVSQIINSDAFRERLAARKEELVDPVLRATIEEKLKALADTSIQVLLEKLHETRNMNVAIRALDVTTRALGYGAKPGAAVQVNNYVALVPPRAASAQEWMESHQPVGLASEGLASRGVVVDAFPKPPSPAAGPQVADVRVED